MTFDQFWNDDCLLTKYYRKAYEIQKNRRNQELWLQGAYIYEVVSDLAPVLQAFAKRGTKATPYVKEPFALSDKEARERRERDEKKKFVKMQEKMLAFMKANNTKLKQEVEQDG